MMYVLLLLAYIQTVLLIAIHDFFSQLKCCGLYSFTDYVHIFNNLSVPVSCCNTCLERKIVSNATLANQTGQIYTEV